MASLELLVRKYRNKGVLIDTNLLLVYLIGTFDKQQLRNCRATKAFEPGELDLLSRFTRQFRHLITTPHVLTEISNLAGKLPQLQHERFRLYFANVIASVSEKSFPAADVAQDQDFPKLGLTDTAIAMLAPEKYLVLTDEFELYGRLNKRGIDVINFNHLRTLRWSAPFRTGEGM